MLYGLRTGKAFPHQIVCGDKFWRMQEVYIRGTTIKYIRIPDEVLEMVKEDSQIVSVPKKSRMGGRDAPRTRGSGRGNPGVRGLRVEEGVGEVEEGICLEVEVEHQTLDLI